MIESVSADVAVVGGGPAGLTAAAVLAERGLAVQLVEASDRLGGMAASVEVAGVRVDLGSHRLHPVATPRVERLLQELLGNDLQTRVRNGRLRLDARWVRFPLHPLDIARHLPPGFAARAIADTARGPVRRRRAGHGADTFAAVVRAGLGPTMLDRFYGPYAEKLWGLPADELAGDLARRRIAANSPARLAAKLANAARRRPAVFRYPRRGYGQLVESLADRTAAAGVTVRLGERVERLRTGATDAVLHLADDAAITARHVFWSAPLDALAAVAADPPAGAGRLRHRAMVLAYLAFDIDRVTPFDAHYLPGPEVLPTRISEPTNYRDGDDPPGTTVLCAEVPCDAGDETWTAGSSELGARIGADLDRLGVTSRPPTEVHVERLTHVYPVVRPADAGSIDRVHRWAQALPHVTVLGRQGLYVADNLHHVVDMALEATECLAGDGTWDAARWTAALDVFARHVVED